MNHPNNIDKNYHMNNICYMDDINNDSFDDIINELYSLEDSFKEKDINKNKTPPLSSVFRRFRPLRTTPIDPLH